MVRIYFAPSCYLYIQFVLSLPVNATHSVGVLLRTDFLLLTYMRRLLYTIAFLSVSCLMCMAQGVFASGSHIATTSTIDMLVGECFSAFTDKADIGFIPSMYHVAKSNVPSNLCNGDIQVHFDNEQQQAIVYITHECIALQPHYTVCGMDGIVHIEGVITSIPQYIDYAHLAAGIYILRIDNISNRAPFATRWIKR